MKPNQALADIFYKKTGYQFQNPALLNQALTHRSFSAQNNERLEFLGDAVLDLIISHILFEKFASLSEGDLSRTRAFMVRQESLHKLANKLELSKLIKLGAGERQNNGHLKAGILADAFEAIIGAIYLDGGLEKAREIINKLINEINFDSNLAAKAQDSKTKLQEILQKHKKPLPEYTVINIHGKNHEQIFEVKCHIKSYEIIQEGKGQSRKIAEQDAAQKCLKILQNKI